MGTAWERYAMCESAFVRHSPNSGLQMAMNNIGTLLNITGSPTESQTKNPPNIIPHFSQQLKCGKFLDCLCHW